MLPIMINTKNKYALIIGAGNVAYRKICKVLDHNMKVIVIAPSVCKKIEELLVKYSDAIKIYHENYTKDFIVKMEKEFEFFNDISFVIAATNNECVNSKIVYDFKKYKILTSSITEAKEIDFKFVGEISRGDLTITVSTNGKFPGLTKKIRKEIETDFPKEYSEYLNYLSKERYKIINRENDEDIKKKRIEELLKISYEKYILLTQEGNK
ncbi:precorrin-2 dehydrogenase/sirohydrochlorin ferrochelatase family protein [Helicovermis profundi]|uniref:precorrin-2 dehydrogenase n=1 Tax=Helicovermis profundi TaxID=3065157 RepID=A0AAU9E309_9FIRM|nr:bifunctional precorrin-2 dehydrogenase/sirohydrochlorin ferrochelatase [Clostridia bacterium S502]